MMDDLKNMTDNEFKAYQKGLMIGYAKALHQVKVRMVNLSVQQRSLHQIEQSDFNPMRRLEEQIKQMEAAACS